MRLTVQRCIESKIPYVFDPGQMIGLWTKDELLEDIRWSNLVIVNQYEYEMLLRITECTEEELKNSIQPFIVTMGAEGSMFLNSGIKSPAAKPESFVNGTGCGDAFRAGVLYAIQKKEQLSFWEEDLVFGMKLGTILASFAIECDEAQNQGLTLEMVEERMEDFEMFQNNNKLQKQYQRSLRSGKGNLLI